MSCTLPRDNNTPAAAPHEQLQQPAALASSAPISAAPGRPLPLHALRPPSVPHPPLQCHRWALAAQRAAVPPHVHGTPGQRRSAPGRRDCRRRGGTPGTRAAAARSNERRTDPPTTGPVAWEPAGAADTLTCWRRRGRGPREGQCRRRPARPCRPRTPCCLAAAAVASASQHTSRPCACPSQYRSK